VTEPSASSAGNLGATLLVARAQTLVTMDAARLEIRGGSVLVQGDSIARVGTDAQLAQWIAEDAGGRSPDRIIDASGCVVLPGLVNCHHHLFQSLTRTIGTAHGRSLFEWLCLLYPIWAEMDPDAVYVSAKTALAELVLSGATTAADHLYLFPNGARLDDEIRAAQEIGVRFHAARGSMSLGESKGGLPPDRIVESEEAILADSQRVIELFHDPRRNAMLRIGLAPCSPFSVTRDLMRETARLARSYHGVGLHTHLAETLDEISFCLQKFGRRPLDYAESVEWLSGDAWFAHMVHLELPEIERVARAGAGVCHCPSSNMILGSGIAPVRQLLSCGVNVALGVDGSASNDGNQMLGEARQAMLLQRAAEPGQGLSANAFPARTVLELATRGGAAVLGRNDIGSLEPGKAADLIAFRVDDLEHAGALFDPVAALVTCAPTRVYLSVINGRVVVEKGILVGADLRSLVDWHNRIARTMLEHAGLA
jgi:8-oxoguanine deaminase